MTSENVNTPVTVFENPEFGRVRIVLRAGEPWLVAKDVCDCLGLGNVSQTVSYLDDDEKLALETNIISNDVGGRGTLVVSEPGFYSLVLRSRKPEAKAFKRWVTHEVLPSIRRTGSYSAPSRASGIDRPYVEALEYFYRSTCKVEGVQVAFAVDRAWKRLDGNSPLELGGVRLQAETVDDDPINYISVTEIGKLFGLSAVKMNPILTGLGLQERVQKWRKVKSEDGTYERDENGGIKQVPAGFDYMPTETGKQFGKRLPKQTGEPEERWHLYWHKEKLPAYLRETYFKEEEN